ncbi:heat stress transcription factor B-2b-like [Apium graveolens]|uniref:heat stress transcription factor B-2b-like n=1 Tax=Apium graveolens TaxID=4045 RepID=UPI003D7C078E
MLDNPDNNNLIAWTANGSSFIVKDKDEFARNLLAKNFRHSNYDTFVRQLNSYGFERVDYGFYEYQHDSFRRGEKHRLLEMHPAPSKRKSSPPADNVSNVQLAPTSSNIIQGQEVVSSTSLSGGAPDTEIVRENKRLREENAALRHELQWTRGRVHYIAGLMKNLAGGEPVSAVLPDQEAQGNPKGGLDV